ncbi:MAG: TonB-dependent receptor, partial [Pyrinomonadaceae bacterium]|nr:TonB-dependent receptor [Pyrinomonadaceae bacterium]
NAYNKYGGPNNAAPIRVNQRLNQFGGSLGGPIPIPRFGEGTPPAFKLGRNRAFFFFSYEGLRSTSADTITALVETPQYRQLVQTQRPGSIAAQILGASGIEPRIISVLPVTCGTVGFPNGQFPVCQQVAGGLDIGSLALTTGQYLPGNQLNGGGLDGIPDVQYAQISVPTSSLGNQFNPRIDLNLTDKDTFTFSSYLSRFSGVGSDTGGRSRPMGDIRTSPTNSFAMLTWTRTLSASMLNEARFNATRFAFNEIQSSSETNFGIPRIEFENLPGERLRFGAPWSETTPGIFAENTFEFRDTLRLLAGNHGWSFGGEIRKEQDNNNLSGGSRPLFTFHGPFDFANDTPLFYQINADPRTGGPAESQRYFRTNSYALFAQDDWKMRPNLTLNLGLRWEYFSPLKEKEGRLSNFILGPAGQELTGGRLVIVDELYPPDRNNFAPRLGFAWSPKQIVGLNFEDKLVVRGGFGIAYNRIPTVLFANTRGNPPFFARYQICCGTSASDFSTPFAGGQILYALGRNNSPASYPFNPALAVPIDPATGSPTGRS